MAAGTQTRVWSGPSRRRVPRFRAQEPLDVTVLRSGIQDTVPGRSVNVSERGIAAMLAGELVPGEAVEVEVRLPSPAAALRARAIVRYQGKLCCGLEFVALAAEQRAAIREWTREASAEEFAVNPVPAEEDARDKTGSVERHAKVSDELSHPRKKRFALVWIVVLILAAFAGGVFWWRWNRAWEELESGLKSQESVAEEKPEAQVPAELMEKLLVHRVEPVYPPEARQARLQGIIALDIVVGRDGSVLRMSALNGPEVLARAAMDALRWWKFEPYRINGNPAVVETTVAVEFKR